MDTEAEHRAHNHADFAHHTCAVHVGDGDSSTESADSDDDCDADTIFCYNARTAPTECFDLDDDHRFLELEDDGDATETLDLDELSDQNLDDADSTFSNQ